MISSSQFALVTPKGSKGLAPRTLGLPVLLKRLFSALKSEMDLGRIYTPKSTSQILEISA